MLLDSSVSLISMGMQFSSSPNATRNGSILRFSKELVLPISIVNFSRPLAWIEN